MFETRVFSTDQSDGIKPETVNGEKITLSTNDGAVTISNKVSNNNDATIVQDSVNEMKGVIHEIDKVLIPTL